MNRVASFRSLWFRLHWARVAGFAEMLWRAWGIMPWGNRETLARLDEIAMVVSAMRFPS